MVGANGGEGELTLWAGVWARVLLKKEKIGKKNAYGGAVCGPDLWAIVRMGYGVLGRWLFHGAIKNAGCFVGALDAL